MPAPYGVGAMRGASVIRSSNEQRQHVRETSRAYHAAECTASERASADDAGRDDTRCRGGTRRGLWGSSFTRRRATTEMGLRDATLPSREVPMQEPDNCGRSNSNFVRGTSMRRSRRRQFDARATSLPTDSTESPLTRRTHANPCNAWLSAPLRCMKASRAAESPREAEHGTSCALDLSIEYIPTEHSNRNTLVDLGRALPPNGDRSQHVSSQQRQCLR